MNSSETRFFTAEIISDLSEYTLDTAEFTDSPSIDNVIIFL